MLFLKQTIALSNTLQGVLAHNHPFQKWGWDGAGLGRKCVGRLPICDLK